MTPNPSIIASCKQTRFHLLDDKPSREIDVQGLTIVISSPSHVDDSEDSKQKAKGKSRSKNEGLEILSNTDLRLKGGVHYGLVGQNGSGKSTLLRAMSEKLIPGIPYATRIASLRQTDVEEDLSKVLQTTSISSKVGNKTILQEVMGSDDLRNEIIGNINTLSKSLEGEDPFAPVIAIRKLQHEKLEKQLFLAHKNASLKSGARGFQARKELKYLEAKVQSSLELLTQNKEQIDPDDVQAETQTAIDVLTDLQSQLDTMRVEVVEQQARRVLLGLGFKESNFDQPLATLSGGWRMRCMLACVLVQNADIMILDEPTNFLDLLGIVWLENYLKQLRDRSGTTVILVSHDRDFINAVCQEIVIIREKSLSYFRGNLSAYEKYNEAQKLYWGRMKEAQERQISHMEATIRQTTKVGKKTGDENKLRMAKSRQRKIDERMGVQVNAKGGRFKLNRDLVGFYEKPRLEIEVPTDERDSSIALPDTPDLRFPGPLISIDGAVFRYKPSAPLILDHVDLVIHKGDRIGIMGLNGSGKSTFLRVLNGEIEPSKGQITRHPRLKIGYYSQHSVDDLQKKGHGEPDLTVLALMVRETAGAFSEGDIRGILSSLGLRGQTVSDVPIARLSGGQLVRLALARIVWNPPHLLVLDEITTHLDFHTVTALASALSSFGGAILLVSHDRFVVRSVIEGKRDPDSMLDDDFEEAEEETEGSARKRLVYVLKSGKMTAQEDGVEQFERILQRRVLKMLTAMT